jgi:hypothetical protein
MIHPRVSERSRRAAVCARGLVALAAALAWPRRASATPQEIELARALDGLGFEQTAAATIGAVLARPGDVTRGQALSWLGNKAAAIPPAARLELHLAHVGADELARWKDAHDEAAARGLAYLEGRAAYAAGRDVDAVRALSRVDRGTPLGPRAAILRGAANVRLRLSVPAMQSFQAAVAEADAAPDAAYLRDFGQLSIARTFGAAAVRLDENQMPTLDAAKVSAAVKVYHQVDPSSDLWPDAAYELGAMHFLAGDYVLAEGYARALGSSTFGGAHALDALILRAVMQFTTCRYELAQKTVTLVQQRAAPIRAALAPLLTQAAASGRPDAFLVMADAVRSGRVPAGAARATIERVMAERANVEKMGYLARLLREEGLLGRAPPDFVRANGDRVRAAVAAERARVTTEASRALRERLEAEVAALDRVSLDGAKILIDLTAAQRNQLDATIVAGLVSSAEGTRNLPSAIPAVLWPFATRLPGDRRRLETGYFYSPSVTRCGR